MSDSSWENDGGSGVPKGLSWWLKAPLILIALLAMLALFLVSRVASTRRLAWPTTQRVFARLATDEGAQTVYTANPALSDHYPTAESFVETLRTWRSKFGALPSSEPQESRETYQRAGGFDNLRVNMKGSGGAWMTLTIVKPSLVTRGAELGEGITDLGFAEDLPGLRARRRNLFLRSHETESQPEWLKFREIVGGLGTDEGVIRLLLDNPNLPHAKNPEAFKTKARAWRHHLEALPSSFQGARGSVEIQRQIGIGTQTITISYRFSQGGQLAATWKNGKLTALDLKD